MIVIPKEETLYICSSYLVGILEEKGQAQAASAVIRASEAAQAAVIGPERDQWRVQYFVRQSEMNRREVDFEHHLEAALRKSDLFLQSLRDYVWLVSGRREEIVTR